MEGERWDILNFKKEWHSSFKADPTRCWNVVSYFTFSPLGSTKDYAQDSFLEEEEAKGSFAMD